MNNLGLLPVGEQGAVLLGLCLRKERYRELEPRPVAAVGAGDASGDQNGESK